MKILLNCKWEVKPSIDSISRKIVLNKFIERLEERNKKETGRKLKKKRKKI